MGGDVGAGPVNETDKSVGQTVSQGLAEIRDGFGEGFALGQPWKSELVLIWNMASEMG